MKLRHLDRFALFNIALFLIMAGTVYYDRFIQYRGAGHLLEFYFYATFVIGMILVGWKSFRHIEFHWLLLLMIEIGIVMHFAGGMVFIDERRLYDHFILGIRYDKYVHFINAFVAAAATDTVFARYGVRLHTLRPLVVLLVVLGMGAVIEIVEYLVTLTVEQNGVGGYDNNMQDLISNLIGGFTYVVWRNLAPRALPAIGGHG